MKDICEVVLSSPQMFEKVGFFIMSIHLLNPFSNTDVLKAKFNSDSAVDLSLKSRAWVLILNA